MPTDACQWFYECKSCQTVLKPLEGDCCVYCSYATVPCPPIQKVSPAAPRGDSGLAQLKGQRTSEKLLSEAAQIKRRVDAIYSSKSDPYCFLSHGSSANGAATKTKIEAVPTMSVVGVAVRINQPPTIAISAMY